MFTYDPFFGVEPYPMPGPVFIHEVECTPYLADGGFPEDLRRHALTFAAYGRGRRLLAEERLEAGGDVDALVGRTLARTDVRYLHVRDTEAGCFDFQIEP